MAPIDLFSPGNSAGPIAVVFREPTSVLRVCASRIVHRLHRRPWGNSMMD